MVVGSTINHCKVVEKREGGAARKLLAALLLSGEEATGRCLLEAKAAGAASSGEAVER